MTDLDDLVECPSCGLKVDVELHAGTTDDPHIIREHGDGDCADTVYAVVDKGDDVFEVRPQDQDWELTLLKRVEQAEAEVKRLRDHILDIDAHATPYGDIPDDPGYVGLYLLTSGALHRALGTVGHCAPKCQAEAILRELLDPEPCDHFDHHGQCQTHGRWDEQGRCLDARGRALLAALDGEETANG